MTASQARGAGGQEAAWFAAWVGPPDMPTTYAVPEAAAMLHVRRLSPGERTAVPDGAYVYAHVVRGEVNLDGERLGAGDAARITAAEGSDAVAGAQGAELLAWEMTAR